MADDQTTPTDQQAAPSAEQVAAVITPPAVPVAPAEGLDETVPGGAYRVRGDWVDAEGNPIKAPKGKK
jgi:hypothetical protein